MATKTESAANVFEEALVGMRKTAEASMEMQQELFRQWGANWPGMVQPQNAWVEKIQKFQKDWAKAVKDLLNKHREVIDEQYRLAMESLDEAFRAAQSSDPQEFAKRCEALCKKSLDVVREAGEMQVQETQEAINKWMALMAKAAN